MKATKGFTLFELLICLSISALLIGTGVPNLFNYLAKMKAKAIEHSIRQAINSARNHSVSLGKTVTICGLDEHENCTRWGIQAIGVFIDNNENRAIDQDDKVFSVAEFNHHQRLWLRAGFGRPYIRYKANGAVKEAGSFIYCNKDYPEASTRITISMPGRGYIGRDLDGDGVVELTSGEPIRCD